jgi:hypothetical protein
MEKVVCALWGEADGDKLRHRLLGELLPALRARSWVHTVRIAVVDSAVTPAEAKRMASRDLPNAVVSLWLDESRRLSSLDNDLLAVCHRYDAYLVTEAEPLVNTRTLSDGQTRGDGFCQVVFMCRPESMSEQDWLDVWQGSHTQIAIDTQSTFGYRQNRVVSALTEHAPEVHAIVEENFPVEAMTSDHDFYAAADDTTLARHQQAMMESCVRFIDFERIDVIPMSEYLSRPAVP